MNSQAEATKMWAAKWIYRWNLSNAMIGIIFSALTFMGVFVLLLGPALATLGFSHLSTAGALLLVVLALFFELGHGIAVDGGGNAYVAGSTNSADFPTANPLQPVFGGTQDAFVAKIAVPRLIVVKHVINDNGGTATAANFMITVTGNSPSPATFPGSESPGTTVTLNAGAYSVGEASFFGYTKTLSADCSGSIAVRETKTCTVTNEDIAPVARGQDVEWLRQFGSSTLDAALGVSVDASGVYVFGGTLGTLPGQTSAGDFDAFVVKLTSDVMTILGFYHPVDMGGVLNTVKNGATVPLKFEVFTGATERTDTSVVTSLTLTQVACTTGLPSDAIEITATGGTSLRYDTTAGQFVYNWKTPNMGNTCWDVTLTVVDGSSITAHFKLK